MGCPACCCVPRPLHAWSPTRRSFLELRLTVLLCATKTATPVTPLHPVTRRAGEVGGGAQSSPVRPAPRTAQAERHPAFSLAD